MFHVPVPLFDLKVCQSEDVSLLCSKITSHRTVPRYRTCVLLRPYISTHNVTRYLVSSSGSKLSNTSRCLRVESSEWFGSSGRCHPNTSTPWSRVLLEKLTVAQLVKYPSHFMEPGSSILYSPQPATFFCLKPD